MLQKHIWTTEKYFYKEGEKILVIITFKKLQIFTIYYCESRYSILIARNLQVTEFILWRKSWLPNLNVRKNIFSIPLLHNIYHKKNLPLTSSILKTIFLHHWRTFLTTGPSFTKINKIEMCGLPHNSIIILVFFCD